MPQENSHPPPSEAISSNTSSDGIIQHSPSNPTEVDRDHYRKPFQKHKMLANNKVMDTPQQFHPQQTQHRKDADGAAVRPENFNSNTTHTSIPIASLVAVDCPHADHDHQDDEQGAAKDAQHSYLTSPDDNTPPSVGNSLPHAQSSPQSTRSSEPDNSTQPNVIDAPVTVVIPTTASGEEESNLNHSSNTFNNSDVKEAQPAQLADFLENRNLQRALGGFLCGAILLAMLVVAFVMLKSQSTTTTTQQEPQQQTVTPYPAPAYVTTPTFSPSLPEPTTHPTLRPTTVAPTATPLIVEGLSQETKRALQNPRSPQSRAYSWLQNHTKLDTFEAFQKRQMMGALSIYYALDGEEAFWSSDLSSPRGNWLSYDVPFCQWTPFQYQQVRGHILAAVATTSSNTSPSQDESNTLLGMCNDQGQLTYLNLHNIINDSRHRGTRIPPEIGLLSHLETFEMNNCQFENNYNQLDYFLPTALGQLTNLRELQFMGNNFKGTIPSSLPSLIPRLQYLNLDQNALHGPIPSQVGSLSQLSHLSLSWNSLHNAIPSEIGLLQTQLETLRLYKNRLVGPIPSEIALLTKLTVMELRQNDISGTLPSNLCGDENLSLLSSIGLDCHQVPCPSGCSCNCV